MDFLEKDMRIYFSNFEKKWSTKNLSKHGIVLAPTKYGMCSSIPNDENDPLEKPAKAIEMKGLTDDLKAIFKDMS